MNYKKRSYGLPFMGSKNRIAKKILEKIKEENPDKHILLDLFGGGFAISDCALYNKYFDKVVYNELDPFVFKYVTDALNNKEDKYVFVSREEFFKNKDNDPYINFIWSYGNSTVGSYLLGKNNEKLEKSKYELLVNNDYSYIKEIYPMFDYDLLKEYLDKSSDPYKKYLILNKFLRNINFFDKNMFRTRSIEGEKRYNNLKNYDNLVLHNKSYDEIDLSQYPPEDTIIYCDPPYNNTIGYNKKGKNYFDNKKFYRWCDEIHKKGYTIYVSEYNLDDNDLFENVGLTFKNKSYFKIKTKDPNKEKLYRVK